jgi:hypothetical protein
MAVPVYRLSWPAKGNRPARSLHLKLWGDTIISVSAEGYPAPCDPADVAAFMVDAYTTLTSPWNLAGGKTFSISGPAIAAAHLGSGRIKFESCSAKTSRREATTAWDETLQLVNLFIWDPSLLLDSGHPGRGSNKVENFFRWFHMVLSGGHNSVANATRLFGVHNLGWVLRCVVALTSVTVLCLP